MRYIMTKDRILYDVIWERLEDLRKHIPLSSIDEVVFCTYEQEFPDIRRHVGTIYRERYLVIVDLNRFFNAQTSLRKWTTLLSLLRRDTVNRLIVVDYLFDVATQDKLNDRVKTTDAVNLAENILETGSFDQMPILADALQDAGYDDEVVLNHCRNDFRFCKESWILKQLVA